MPGCHSRLERRSACKLWLRFGRVHVGAVADNAASTVRRRPPRAGTTSQVRSMKNLLLCTVPRVLLGLLCPIMTVIVFFHFMRNPGGVPWALVLVVTGGLLVCQYRGNLRLLAISPVKRVS